MATKRPRRPRLIIGSHVSHPIYGNGEIVSRDGRASHIIVIDRRTNDTMTIRVPNTTIRKAA